MECHFTLGAGLAQMGQQHVVYCLAVLRVSQPMANHINFLVTLRSTLLCPLQC